MKEGLTRVAGVDERQPGWRGAVVAEVDFLLNVILGVI